MVQQSTTAQRAAGGPAPGFLNTISRIRRSEFAALLSTALTLQLAVRVSYKSRRLQQHGLCLFNDAAHDCRNRKNLLDATCGLTCPEHALMLAAGLGRRDDLAAIDRTRDGLPHVCHSIPPERPLAVIEGSLGNPSCPESG